MEWTDEPMEIEEIYIWNTQESERLVERFMHVLCGSVDTVICRSVTNETELGGEENLVTFSSFLEPAGRNLIPLEG
jgi:hypothetical protein